MNQLLRAITKHTHAYIRNANVRVRRIRKSQMAKTSIIASPSNVRYEITFQNIMAIASNENKLSDLEWEQVLVSLHTS